MDTMDTSAQSSTDHTIVKDEPVQEVRCLIDNSQVGGIIGKAGANVAHVREESGAFLSILKAEFKNVQERIMVLKGTSSQIAQATFMVAQLIVDGAARDKKEQFDEGVLVDATIRYLVHRSAVGAIIGKAGAVIQETQKQTGARVQVSNDPLPQSTEKSVTMTGSPTAILKAASRVLLQLRENPLRSGTKVYPYVPGQPIFAQTPYGVAPSPYPSHGLYQHPYGMAAHTAAASSTQKIAIPTVCAGCVIGKGGSVIRDLRAQSATNISIADPDPSAPNERVVTLTGAPQCIQTAVYLIRQLVEQYQPPM